MERDVLLRRLGLDPDATVPDITRAAADEVTRLRASAQATNDLDKTRRVGREINEIETGYARGTGLVLAKTVVATGADYEDDGDDEGGLLEAGAIIASQYEILALIGAGGMGAVYEARDTVYQDRVVALKVIRPDLLRALGFRERFLKEAVATQNLVHINIVNVLAAGRDGDLLYIAMERLQGKPLDELLAELAFRGQRIDRTSARRLGEELCEAIYHAHGHDLIHRDIKPSNLFICSDGSLKLMDFGIVRDTNAPSQFGGTIGTVAYMAPEQAGGVVTHHSDQFSAALVLYEALTGVNPKGYERELPAGTPSVKELNTEVPSGVSEAIAQALQNSPLERFETMLHFRDALDRGWNERVHAVPSDSGVVDKDSVVAERYKITSLIGEGGMGAVYEARDTLLQGEPCVALKVILAEFTQNEEARRRFLTEAEKSRGLAHANIVNVFDVGRDGDRLYLTMERLEGESLHSRLTDLRERGVRLGKAQARQIGEELCEALYYAHDKKLVHRDVKPSNIFICTDGSLRLMDFGIVRDIDDVSDDGNPVGTLAYMAPEQASGKLGTNKSDQFSAGLVLYEILTGTNPKGTEREVPRETPSVREVRPNIPDGVSAAIARSLHPLPRERFATMRAFRDALTRGWAEAPLPRPPLKWRRWAAGAAATLLATFAWNRYVVAGDDPAPGPPVGPNPTPTRDDPAQVDEEPVKEPVREQARSQTRERTSEPSPDHGGSEGPDSLLVQRTPPPQPATVDDLFGAVRIGADVEVEELLAGGLAVDAENADGKQAIHVAAELGQTEVVRVLLKRSADAVSVSGNGLRPLHYAASGGHHGVLTILLANPLVAKTVNVVTQDFSQRSALHYAAGAVDLEAVEALIAAGADPAIKNHPGQTAFHVLAMASTNHNLKADVALLLLKGLSDRTEIEVLNAPDSRYETALSYSQESEANAALTALLEERGAK